MEVYLAQPRGFCAGVVRAIEIVERALEKYGPPVSARAAGGCGRESPCSPFV